MLFGVLVAVLQVALERGLALQVVLALELIGHVLQHDDVGLDALGLDRAARRRVVARRGQPQRAIVLAERDDRLHRALAERTGADQRRALVVLQRAGNDLRSRRRAAVDEHHHGLALGNVDRPRIVTLRFIRVPSTRRNDLAALEEGVGDGHRLVEQAAGIVAQIENVALELVARHFLLELLHRGLQAIVGLLVELRDPDIADVVAFLARANRLDLDDRARELDLELLLFLAAQHGQRDIGVHRAAHLVDRLIQRHALHALAVDGDDQIGRHDAGARGGRVVDRGHDFHDAVFLRHLDAEAAELAARLHLHVAEALGVHVARMRIERGQHAVDRRFHQLLVLRLLDIIRANLLEDVAEQVEAAIGVGNGGRGRLSEYVDLLGDPEGRGADDGAQQDVVHIAHHPRTFFKSGLDHQGAGSTGEPSFLNST